MDTATRVQILDETDCISHSTNTLGKGMNPIILPPAMGKIVGQTMFFSRGEATSLGEGKLWIQTLKLRLKIDHVSYPARADGLVNRMTKTIQVRRTKHAGHCWRSSVELISDVLLWTPSYDRAKVGGPAPTYIPQLCEDTECKEEWRERESGISVLAAHDHEFN